MNRSLNLTDVSSNTVYALPFPQNIMNFIKYDFSAFMEKCVDLCRYAMRGGEYPLDDIITLRNSISNCHKYFEKNIHGVFDKIVTDCWIEYICRQNEIGIVSLWNSFIPCRNDFEKAVFLRLSEYRGHRAINQWVNLLRIQEYANRKADFIFGGRLDKISAASARANYFDLMFNVVANEIGFETQNNSAKVYSMGRLPNSQYVMSNISKEIVRNVLTEVKYTQGKKHVNSEALSDQAAMEAFSVIKTFIPEESDSITDTIIKSMTTSNGGQKVFIPPNFKSVIDLEIDAVIDSGSMLQRCGRCREYFIKDDDYWYDYCERRNSDGRTCLEIMTESDDEQEYVPRSEILRGANDQIPVPVSKVHRHVDKNELSFRCDRLYKEMSERVNVEMNQRDFSDWYRKMLMMRDNVMNGGASMEDFDEFESYSRSISFKPQNKIKDSIVADYDSAGREVKPFVPKRIDATQVLSART